MRSSENLIGRYALEYASLGMRVFPCRSRAKEPAARGYQSSATSDVALVTSWWHDCPEANIGVLLGDGVFVLDADRPEAETFVTSFGIEPTATVTTARGRHFYLRGLVQNTTLDIGLDVIGRGKYVLGAGSIHPQTLEPYTWEHHPHAAGTAGGMAPKECLRCKSNVARTARLGRFRGGCDECPPRDPQWPPHIQGPVA
jgi:hypothetical protein